MKKTTKKRLAKKLTAHDKITKVLAKVSEICDYAIENQCTEQAQFEELEWMLNDCFSCR